MKKIIALAACVCLGLASGHANASGNATWAEPGVALKIHYAGSDKLAAAAAGSSLNTLLKLAATQEFKRQIADKLALAPQQWFQGFLDKKDQKERLRPLAEDVLSKESVLELARGGADDAFAWGLGAHVGSDRAKLWSTNLWQFFSEVKGMKPGVIPSKDARGWEAAMAGKKLTFRLVQDGDWCAVGMGSDSALVARLLGRIVQKKGIPLTEGAWLSFHADVAGLKLDSMPGLLSVLPMAQRPVLEGAFSCQSGSVRTKGTIDFAVDNKWDLEPWRVPVDLIRDPLVSFTAMQGIRPWVANQAWARQLELNPVPNQYFIWAQGEVPFLTYAAAPVKGASSVFSQIASRVPSVIWNRILGFKVGEMAMQTNKSELGWSGLPLLSPFLRPETASGGEYLLAGLFHVVNSTNPAPSELLSQFTGRTNLLMYEWELSQERLGQLHVLSQIKELITPASLNSQPDTDRTNACMQPWITSASTHLGNTITAITVQSPRKLSLSRQSNLGLDGMELMAVLQWLDDVRFPLYGKSLSTVK
jgi:hypothetical protein